jgi:hypothetical protein
LNQATRDLVDAVDAYIAWTEGDGPSSIGAELLKMVKERATLLEKET